MAETYSPRWKLPIEPGDDAVSLAHKVLEAEHDLYPATLAEFVKR